MRILILCAIIMVASCERKPYVEHKIKFEKVSDGCAGVSPAFGLNSNFGGERYEFQKCLPANFSKEQVTSSRSGDSVIVNFPKPDANSPSAVFAITLDIDSYPKYHRIVIDNEEYTIVPSN